MNLVNIINIHIQHGHLPVLVSGILRLISLIPLIIVSISVTKTYVSRLHSINGLRSYRLAMMSVLIAAIIDQILFVYFDVQTLFSDVTGVLVVHPGFLVFNSLVTLMAYYFLYLLFRHASKKGTEDEY